MVGSSLNSSSLTLKPIKFLCSYGGRIVPRYPDGKLRYHGGETRVLSVNSSVSFAELLVKMGKMCGSPVSLRCQLPMEDLDALVSITSDEDLANLIEEYDHSAEASPSSYKIRAFLSAPKTVKSLSLSPSAASFYSSAASPPKSPFHFCSAGGGIPPRCPNSASRRYVQQSASKPAAYSILSQKAAGKIPPQFGYQYHNRYGNGCGLVHLVHNGNLWQ